MKFWEAMKALEEGNKVRVKEWSPGAYWWFKSSSSLDATITDIFILSTKEWELYEEPQKTYSFSEVVKGLKLGKKFRRKSFPDCPAIYLLKGEGDIYISGECWGSSSIEDFEATDWIEVK